MTADFDRAVLRRIAPVLSAAGIPSSRVGCRNERHGFDMIVHLTLPRQVDRVVTRALSVRVLDTVAESEERFGSVDVQVDAPEEPSHWFG